MTKIINIKNRTTRRNVCNEYKGKELELSKCKFTPGEQLVIVYKDGMRFQHEDVETVIHKGGLLRIRTTKKIWNIDTKID